jgi:uncharacterized protein YdeI (YjbR/CyaY-like superfamily)
LASSLIPKYDILAGMEITRTFTAVDRATWRAWLAEHAATETEIWLVYCKKQTGTPCVAYLDSLEEALCFGWVDSLIQKIDEDKYARKFTPRKAGSRWSALNRHLVAKLIGQGLMTEAGLARVDFPHPEVETTRPRPAPLPLPDWLESTLKTSPRAWQNFQKLPLSHRRRYIAWISAAKREETRQKRLREAILLLEGDRRLGIGPGEVRK